MYVLIRFVMYLHSFHKLNCHFMEICDEVANENMRWYIWFIA